MLEIKEMVSLLEMTTFKVGGLAKFFVVVRSESEILEALKYANENGLKIFVLGGGSNVVIADKGFDGLVIKLENKTLDINKDLLNCQAGAGLFEVVKAVAEKGLSGLEWAAGIPGTFGGAVRGNAGAFGGEISKNIESVTALNIETYEKRDFSKEDCDFSYRSSFFKKNPQWIIVSAKMKFSFGDKDKSQEMIREIISKRTQNQPQGFASAGSFFQNPVVGDKEIVSRFEKDIGAKAREGKVAAGWLIAQAGIKGKKIGGAMISEKHANFLVNAGGAKADDIMVLASYVKQQVRDKVGVQLMEEVQYVGF